MFVYDLTDRWDLNRRLRRHIEPLVSLKVIMIDKKRMLYNVTLNDFQRAVKFNFFFQYNFHNI